MKLFKRCCFIFTMVALLGSLVVSVYAKSVPLVLQVATVNASSLRLRSGPSTGSSTLAIAPRNDYVMITGKSGNWYRVEYNLIKGYMHENYLKTYLTKNVELGYGVVTAQKVNLRAGPGTGYRVIAHAGIGERAYIIGFNAQWYKVIAKNQICYIRSDYLEMTQIPYENQESIHTPIFFRDGRSTGIIPSAEALAGGSNHQVRSCIVDEARKYYGVPYLWGGSTPAGFDCSGYVQYVLKQCGVTVPRTTELQAQIGNTIKKSDLLPGDLVFLQNTYRSGVSHVGIYIGNNQMIHSSSSKGVTVSDITTAYYIDHFHSVKRIIA